MAMDVMRCLPDSVRDAVAESGIAWDAVTDLRLRAGSCSAVGYCRGGKTGNRALPALALTEEDLRAVLTKLCAGSVHVYNEGLLRGYFSPQLLPGVRVGAAGRLLTCGGQPERLQALHTLCIRLPHAVTADSVTAARLRALVLGKPMAWTDRSVQTERTVRADGGCPIVSTLFYAPPGVGKTSLLRCLIRTLCSVRYTDTPVSAAVLDTGEELCGDGFADCTVDRFSGYPRGVGMEIATRAFAPQVLICDEIGSEAEAEEILRAQISGVPLIATAHADSLETLLRRPCFARLHENGVFFRYVRLSRDADGTGFLFDCEEER